MSDLSSDELSMEQWVSNRKQVAKEGQEMLAKETGVSAVLHVGDIEDGKHPQNVQCADCNHVWVGLYLPQPISVAARMMKNLTCPKCGADSKRIRMAT